MNPQPTNTPTIQSRALDRWVETVWHEEGIRRAAREGYEYADDLLVQLAELLGRSIHAARGLRAGAKSFSILQEGDAEYAHTKLEKRKAPHASAFLTQDAAAHAIDELEPNALRPPNTEIEIEGIVRASQRDPDGDPFHFTAVVVRLAHPIAKHRVYLLLSAEAS
jgi:hypothetical protein